MSWLTLQKIAKMTGGGLYRCDNPDLMVESLATDSRQVKPDQLFIAIRGERFDAHDFVDALPGKAAAALVHKKIDCDLPQIVVPDTLNALADFAAEWRKQFSRPVVALTGSNGKTTLKEMIATILSLQGKVLATHGNLNNNIGMPLTLLRLRKEHDFAVIEMGANHFKEIEFLTKIARPDVAVVNNAGAAHLQGFGDLQGVAKAKGEIFDGLGTNGVAIINADDQFADFWRDSNKNREIITFGIAKTATINGQIMSDGGLVIQKGSEQIRVDLKLLGRHNAMNALAATAVATALGVKLETIVKGLESLTPVKGRLFPLTGISNTQILDDTYNANPDSTAAALEVLAQRSNTALVLGDMAELGENVAQLHQAIGEKAKKAGIERMYCLGKYSALACEKFGENGKSFRDMNDLLATLKKEVTENMTILIKGSRSMRMERAVEGLTLGNIA